MSRFIFFLCLEGDRIAKNSAVKLSTTGLAPLRRVETVKEVLNQGFSHCKQRKPLSLFFHASIKNWTYFSHHTICSCSVSRTLKFSTWSLIFLKKKYLIFLAFSFFEGVVEPVWFFSPPRKRTVKKKNHFVVNRKTYFILRRPVFESKRSIH